MDNVDRARGRAWPSIPSQPILSAGVITTEHAKKHELVRGLVAERKTETELTNDARLKKPAIGQMKLDLLAQAAFRADAVAVTQDEYPQHQLRIDRGPANLAVEGPQLLAKLPQHMRNRWIDPAKQMTRRNAIFQLEQVEQSTLIS